MKMCNNMHGKLCQLKLNDMDCHVYCHIGFDVGFGAQFDVPSIIHEYISNERFYTLLVHLVSKWKHY